MAKTPFKKRSTKPKRAARRPARRSGADRTVHLPGTLAPQRMITQFKYVTQFQKLLLAGGGVQSLNQYRLNSIYDPDYTTALSGTSALGIQQWRNIYQRYRVYKVAYQIRLTNLTPDTTINGAIVPANYVDTALSVSDFMRPMARRFELGNNNGMNRTLLKGVIHLPKLMGVTPVQYKADGTTECGFAANPAQPLLMNIIFQSSNTSGQPAIAAQVEFTYYTEMMGIDASPEALDHSTGLSVVPVAISSSPA